MKAGTERALLPPGASAFFIGVLVGTVGGLTARILDVTAHPQRSLGHPASPPTPSAAILNRYGVQRADGSLLNPLSGRCLKATGGATGDGTLLRIHDCDGSAGQEFALS